MSENGHCITISSRRGTRSVELIRLALAAVALLFLVGCNLIGGDGKSESGIAGDGVMSGNALSKIGDGSDSSWSDSCVVVEEKTEWRWGWWEDDYLAPDPGSDVTFH